MEEKTNITEVRSEHWEPDRSRRNLAYKITQLIWLLLSILEVLLGLRFLLKLLAANPYNPIAELIYSITNVFLAPFMGLTRTPSTDGVVLEIYTLIAMLIYALIGWAIVRIVWLILYRPGRSSIDVSRTEERTDQTSSSNHGN